MNSVFWLTWLWSFRASALQGCPPWVPIELQVSGKQLVTHYEGFMTVKLMKAWPSADHWNAAASYFFLPGLDLVGPSHPSSPPQPFRPPCTFSLDLNGYLLSHLFTISCLSGLSCPCLKFWAPKGQGLCLFAVLLVQRLIQQVGVSITAFVSEKAFGSSNSA